MKRSSTGLTYKIRVLHKLGGTPHVWEGRAACLMDAFALARRSFNDGMVPGIYLTAHLLERRDSE